MRIKLIVWFLFTLVLIGGGATSVSAAGLSRDGVGLAGPFAVQADGGSGAGGELLVSTPGPQQSTSAVASSDDGYLVVWEDSRSGDSDIYGQLYSAAGVPLGENLVIATGAQQQSYPAVAYNPSTDEYLVVWAESHLLSGWDIYGQRVSAAGGLAGGPFRINEPSAGGNQTYPTVDYNVGSYLVAWEDNRDFGNSGWDLYARLVGPGGERPFGSFPVNTGVGDQVLPDVACHDEGSIIECVVAWEEHRLNGSYAVSAQRLSTEGTLIGNTWVMGFPGSDQSAPAVVWNRRHQEYFLVWTECREGGSTGCDIYGQRFYSDGSVDQGAVAIGRAPGTQSAPDVAFDRPTHQYLVVWQDDRDGATSGQDIYGRRVFTDDEGLKPARQGDFVICDTAYGQYAPAVAYSAASRQFFVTWHDQRNGTSLQVYGQRVWWPGLLLGSNMGISAAQMSQDTPAVAYNTADHEYLVVWADERNGDADVYGQLYDRDGLPLGGNLVIRQEDGDQVEPAVAYSSAENEFLVVWENERTGSIDGQVVGAQGTYVFNPSPILISADGSAVRYSPAVAYNSTNNTYLVVFVHSANVTGECDLYGRALLADGSPAVDDFVICSASLAQRAPDVAYNATDNEFLVVWEDYRNLSYDIYGRRVGAWQNPLAGDFAISDALPSNQQAPAVAHNPDGDEYLVVWHDGRGYGATGMDIYAQRVQGGSETLQGSNFAVSTSAGLDDQQYPAVLYAGALDRYRVVWQDGRNADTNWDIYGQWVSAGGATLGAFDVPIVRYSGFQEYPAIAYSPDDGRALTVWQDGRSAETDIYARFGALDLTPPTARFTRDPNWGFVGETFTFNAWPSTDNSTPRGALLASWDFGDSSAGTGFTFQKYITHTFAAPGVYTVTLAVSDLAWLTDTVHHRVWVTTTSLALDSPQAATALPPTATLTVSPTFGVVDTSFSFDGSGSAGTGPLLARWDWENDGEFDLGFGPVLTATHAYTVAGDYTVRLEVYDEATGLSDAALHNLTVLPGMTEKLEVAPGSARIVPGHAVRFRATGWDGYDNEMHHPGVAWSMTGPQAGMIGANGLFTASLEAGTYLDAIRADSGGVTDNASLTVFWPYQTYLPVVARDY
jgi:PKD repeat protein